MRKRMSPSCRQRPSSRTKRRFKRKLNQFNQRRVFGKQSSSPKTSSLCKLSQQLQAKDAEICRRHAHLARYSAGSAGCQPTATLANLLLLMLLSKLCLLPLLPLPLHSAASRLVVQVFFTALAVKVGLTGSSIIRRSWCETCGAWQRSCR